MRINVEEDYRKAREDISIVSVLEFYGYCQNRDKKYSCPFHQEKTPSASVKNNRLKCFGCGKVATTIDLVMELEGVDQFTAVRRLLGNKLNIRINKIEEIEEDKQNNYKYVLSKCRALSKDNYGYIIPYLNSRRIKGILDSLEILKDNGIELEILHNYFEKKNYIVYHFPKYKFMIQKAIDRSCKRNFGTTRPIYFKINDTDLWFIVEGIEDCLSLLITYKFNVVCLNSTTNINKFFADLKKKNNIDVTFVIATDLDTSGEKCKEELIRFFKETDIKYSVYKDFYRYAEKYKLKDVNACLVYSHNNKGGII